MNLIALSDPWAQRRLTMCFADFAGLQPAARRMVERAVVGEAGA